MKPIQYLVAYFSLLLAPLTGFAQFDIPEIPEHQTSVYDYAKLFNYTERIGLEEKLLNYADSTTTQIVIATVTDLKGDSAARVAPLWGQKWGVGQKDKDNGIFILVSRDDRDMYVATGYGVQGRLTAGTTGVIVRNYILPDFKEGHYYDGLDKGTDAIFKALSGKFKVEKEAMPWWKDHKNPWVVLMWLFILISGLYGGLMLFAWLTRFLPDYKNVAPIKEDTSWILPRSTTTRNRGFKGGFGGGRFSGGGAGGGW